MLFAGCSRKIQPEEVIATVGNVVLTRSALDRELALEGKQRESESEYIMQWVHRELMFQEAHRLRLDHDKALEEKLERVKKDFLVNKLLEQTFAQKIHISEEQIQMYYEEHMEDFRLERDEIHGYHILTNNRTDADLARQSLDQGVPFADVAEMYSTGMFKGEGGDMGFFGESDVIPEIWRIASRARIDEISRVFTSEHGFHILKVTEKREKGSTLPLSAVRNDIALKLRINEERLAYFELIDNLENRQKVYVNVPRNVQ
ncbi:peptidyl-prolyl cis-trans isomerase [bacterium]|nr:peptidyl-prolyl cis-trans isomerase [bacterium]